MRLKVFNDKITLGRAAAEQAATAIRRAISERGEARIIAATAASQLEFLDALTKASGIDWTKVEAFHLDEYIGIPITHPGSFRKMLMEQLVVKTGIRQYHLLAGDAAEPAAVVRQIGTQLASAPIDIAFSALVRTAILRLTTHLLTSIPKSPTSLSISMRLAANSKWAKRGSPTFRRFRSKRFRCQRNRSSKPRKFWRLFLTSAKPGQ
jgi:hypothetical protein